MPKPGSVRRWRDILGDAAADLFQNQILDEASTSYDRCAEEPCGISIHIRTSLPALIRSYELETDFVF